MNEQAAPPVLGGMISRSSGVALITWQPDKKGMYHSWHLLYFRWREDSRRRAFPLRRYGLTITNEPVFLPQLSPSCHWCAGCPTL